MLNSTEGIFHTIEMGKTTPLNVAFTIEPGIYPYALVVMSNKTGVKSSFQTTNTMVHGLKETIAGQIYQDQQLIMVRQLTLWSMVKP